MRTVSIVAAALLFGLAACSPNPHQLPGKTEASTELSQHEPAPLGPPSRWLCENGRTLTTTVYAAPDRVDILFLDGSHRTLPQVVSASGVLYEADTLRFHTKGDEAYYAEGERVTNCEKSPTE